jgi:hypothetical protein
MKVFKAWRPESAGRSEKLILQVDSESAAGKFDKGLAV